MDESESPFDNNLFSNHFLKERIDELDEWQEASLEEKYEAFVEIYEKNQRLFSNSPNESRTWSNFTSKVFKEILDHFDPQSEPSKYVSGTEYNPDYTLFNDFNQFLDAQENDEEFETCYAIVENKRWDRTLDKSTQDHRNPAFQTYNYVDRLRVNWGILTNGKEWRLYSYEDCEADTFYQIDVVEQIIKEDDREKALRNFKYFYLFFSKEAFTPKEEGFADKVLKGSFNYAQSLEEDLEKRIYDALEETSRGFFEFNDLEKTEENVDLVHRSSLILLYRLLFVLNAESRELLPVNEKLYRNKLSLVHFRENLKEEEDDGVFGDHDWAWDRLTRLFKAIDSGKQYGDYKITAYNGGLFRYPENADEDEEVDEENVFLANHKLSGQKFKEILKLLALSENEEEEEVLVDYKDLNIRHLGSVYEGLLEHELAVAEEDLVLEDGEWTSAEDSSTDFSEAEDKVREGQVYITNESGERKATGSYYTPEYIVEYIIENTVKPKVEDKIEEAEDEEEILEKVKELNICDPAMGSGHFLTEATSFIAHKIAEEAQLEGKVDEENEIVWLKRQVVQNSIYGVDINPLAVELGKLSLWIETMAEGKPLSFLDHHLKVGNSLIGTSIEELEHHPGIEERPEADFEEIFGVQNARDALHLEYQKIEEMPEESKEDVHEKEQAYREFREENFYYKFLKKLSNVHTYLSFEEELSPKEYNQIRNEVMEIDEHEDEVWYSSAQSNAENRNYFHWELEFPKVFFSTDSGFDAVIGNPPYVKIQNIPEEQRKVFEERYEVAKERYDLYGLFVERCNYISSDKTGLILPNKFFEARAGRPLRQFLKESGCVESIVDFNQYQVFEDVTTYTCLLFLSNNSTGDIIRYKSIKENAPKNLYEENFAEIDLSQEEDKWSLLSINERSVVDKTENTGEKFSKITDQIQVGVQTSANSVFILRDCEKEGDYIRGYSKELGKEVKIEEGIAKPFVTDKEVRRYGKPEAGKFLIYPYESDGTILTEDEISENYPEAYNYLQENKSKLSSRGSESQVFEKWYAHWCPRHPSKFERSKIIIAQVAKGGKCTYDSEGETYFSSMVYSPIFKENYQKYDKAILGILNSSLVWHYIKKTGTVLRGGYYRYKTDYLEPIGMPVGEDLTELRSSVESTLTYQKELNKLNTEIDDYLQNYREGEKLGEIYKPASGVGDSVLTETKETKEKLQVEEGKVVEDGSKLVLQVSTRYKPENKAAFDTDNNGYTYTDFIPAMEFKNLSQEEKALIKEYVPIAIEQEREGFRANATKSNSLIDRLKELKLPKVEDVSDELASFVEEKERAEELRNKIEDQEQEINEIVYSLYDLTEEEIETVEEAI